MLFPAVLAAGQLCFSQVGFFVLCICRDHFHLSIVPCPTFTSSMYCSLPLLLFIHVQVQRACKRVPVNQTTHLPEAVRKAVMIYANLTNRHLGTMVISTVKRKKKKHIFLPLFSVNCLQGMHFAYAHIWAGNGPAEIPSDHLPFHILCLCKSFACVWMGTKGGLQHY